ncbi:response regulator with CheY-like receiver domain and winged-helix DNA-binding domain [Thioflavicoccus mobilis 8321]|uniref:Response regulator with CheY-like receiver domain and winged-helix DNA-binding domain n=1 Tax=Thioflavicoccus mobilis 8321 TaxID=765912 RepID=L0GYX4_9GAMM|nr:response regulator transcription factor [Thioflavicoccus mobilis]AGA90499.1 response regulator with CheY-like receiver domain and winged-helix DNA-binding domain [Thioflavicoccus mobilis 8321]
MRVLLVEDDERLAAGVTAALEAAGFVVDAERDGEAAWFKGDTENYVAVILDLGLPSLDGLSILRRWRAGGQRVPVLILTARGDWNERVEGIDAGADDYLPKPFRMEELLARLRALVRRAAGQASAVLVKGPLMLDTRRMAVSVDGVPIHLSPQEYRLVSYLMQHAGRVVSQLELTEQLYAQDFERDSNAVEVLVGRVRRKLGMDIIQTRRGFGYLIEQTDQ